MNIFAFRPFKGKFNLGDSADIPENEDGTLIGAVKEVKSALTELESEVQNMGVKAVYRGTVTASNNSNTLTVTHNKNINVDKTEIYIGNAAAFNGIDERNPGGYVDEVTANSFKIKASISTQYFSNGVIIGWQMIEHG